MPCDLRVRLGSLVLQNPVLAAAGTFGYGVEFSKTVSLKQLGAIVIKTLTRNPKQGNLPPRLAETPSGMLNAVGLQNMGIEPFVQQMLPKLKGCGTKILVSILGESEQEVIEMVECLDQAEGVDGIELNLSCPNIQHSSEFGVRSSEWKDKPVDDSALRTPHSALVQRMVAQDPQATYTWVQTARRVTKKPLIAKLSPDVTDLIPIAQAAEKAKADALTIANTYTAMRLNPITGRSVLGSLTGGLSGPAIRPLTVWRVWYTARSVKVP
ncbi:MAG: dihydroorotate dehydrogenase, partial [Candidatus Omnitrophica bacterium]|nr:dihydroorotate dehydrogenase [Candidatus Omnitrophota bacterium]